MHISAVIARLAARRQFALALSLAHAVQRGSGQGSSAMHAEAATRLRDRVLLHWALERVFVAGLEAPAEGAGDAGGGGAMNSEASAAALADALSEPAPSPADALAGIGRAAGAALGALSGELILFTVTFCANPADDLTRPPSYI